MKRLGWMACALALLLCGCSSGEKGREPEDTVLVQVLGVDRMGGTYLLTAAGKDSAGNMLLQTVTGETLAQAFDAMPASGEKWFSLTNVSHFLLGDGVEPGELLTFILSESGMSWRALVWYAPLAAALMGEQEDGGAARLEVLKQSGTETVSVLDALAELTSEGTAALPVLSPENGTLTVKGALWYDYGEGVGEK